MTIISSYLPRNKLQETKKSRMIIQINNIKYIIIFYNKEIF